jgi:predicted nucleotidyltransferase
MVQRTLLGNCAAFSVVCFAKLEGVGRKFLSQRTVLSMKHEAILNRLVSEAYDDTNVSGFLVFGSVATGTQREDSDIDVITVFQSSKPSSGIQNRILEGIKVGEIFFTYGVLVTSVETVPYLLHPLGKAKLLLDRNGTVEPLLDRIRSYFEANPGLVEQWDEYYALLKEEKARFGFERTTIIDVWNELERRQPRGSPKRLFFNAFYMTNPWVLLKRLM